MLTEEGVALNTLAREQMKLKLLCDIRIDLTVCELEGLDYREYVRSLRAMLGEIDDALSAALTKRGASDAVS